MEDVKREPPLFEASLPFKLQLGDSNPKGTELMLRLYSGAHGGARSLYVEVSADDCDASSLLLHTLLIGEQEFAALKADQRLLVDFAAFHGYLIQLLQGCSGSNFSCALTARDATPGSPSTFSIVETNAYKQLTHLSLQLRAGGDTAIKRFLAGRLAHARAACAHAEGEAERARAEAAAGRAAADAAAAEAQRARIDADLAESRARQDAAAQISSAREASAVERAESERAFRSERTEAQARHDAEAADLRARLEALRAQQAASQERVAALEADLRDTEARARAAESSLAEERHEGAGHKSASHQLQGERIEREKALATAATQVAVLGQQLADMRELLKSRSSELSSVEGARRELESTLAHYKEAYAKASTKMGLMEGEIAKGNSIVETMHEELKSSKAKGKARSEEARAAEGRAADRERALLVAQREADTLRAQLDRERAEAHQSRSLADELKRQVADARESTERDQQTIAWLNKELSEIAAPPSALPSYAHPSAVSARARAPASRPSVSASVAYGSASLPAASRALGGAGYSSGVQVATSSSAANASTLGVTGNPSASAVMAAGAAGGAVAGTAPPTPASNPYLQGTKPLMEALADLHVREGFVAPKTSSYFRQANPNNLSSPVPGGGPSGM